MKNVRNRLGWTADERHYQADRAQGHKKEIFSLVIPVLVYRRRLSATINTLGQFSKVSQELASYSITKGATFQEVAYRYNEISRTMNIVVVPIATNRGSIVSVKCLVDRCLKGSSMVLGMPAIRKLGYHMRVGNITAKTQIRTIKRNLGEHLQQMDRERLSSRNEPRRRRRNSREDRRERRVGERLRRNSTDHRRQRQGRSSSNSETAGRRYHESPDEIVVGLSREEMDEIQSWG